jgi:hypothetical protein
MLAGAIIFTQETEQISLHVPVYLGYRPQVAVSHKLPVNIVIREVSVSFISPPGSIGVSENEVP